VGWCRKWCQRRLAAEARKLLRASPQSADRAAALQAIVAESQHARLDDLLELSAAYQALVQETEDHTEAVMASSRNARKRLRR
jgi:hypothetical protein